MKRICIVLLVLLTVQPMFAAMSDATAVKQARMRWGKLARIGTVRCEVALPGCTTSNWTKQVGISGVGCNNEFVILGSGPNTWENAFADADAHPVPVVGPLKGTVQLKAKAFDDVSVVKLDFIIDSMPLNAQIQQAPAPQWDVAFSLNTTLLVTGLHAVCATASDAAGNTGRSGALLFTVDQSIAGTTPQELRANAVDLRPSVSMPATITEWIRWAINSLREV